MLPLALLDLTLAQARLQNVPIRRYNRLTKALIRETHALAFQTNRVAYPGPSFTDESGPSVLREQAKFTFDGKARLPLPPVLRVPSSHPVSHVRSRVEELITQPVSEAAAVEAVVYSEEELQNIYADLLESPMTSKDGLGAIAEPNTSLDRQEVLGRIGQRLNLYSNREGNETGLSEFNLSDRLLKLQGRTNTLVREENNSAIEVSPRKLDLEANSSPLALHSTILATLSKVLEGFMKVEATLSNEVGDILQSSELTNKSTKSRRTPVLLLSTSEWIVLVQECIALNDLQSAEDALQMMQNFGAEVPESLSREVLRHYSRSGDVDAVVAFISRFANGIPSEMHRDQHIKSHLKSPSPDYNVGTALETLHKYESMGLNPPMKSYARIIGNLFHSHNPAYHAQAWDLFAHMRYVAHPTPDQLMYAQMIRACAGTGPSQSSISSQPERALDLWTEMRATLGEGVVPSVDAYNAVILACARARGFAGDAFRLAREMLDTHRDAFGRPLLRPNVKTFCALLVAAKMTGDLPRVRWILAEMLSLQNELAEKGNGKELALNESVMMHVFHAYASYKPPFRRESTRILDENVPLKTVEAPNQKPTPSDLEVPETKAFSVIPPQTSGEVSAEAKMLMNRIIADQSEDGNLETNSDRVPGTFSNVNISARLLNSYISVFYKHASLEEAAALFFGSEARVERLSIFDRLQVQPTLRSYVEALERCQFPVHRNEHDTALEFANKVWQRWEDAVNAQSSADGQRVIGLTARLVERGWAAMIRVLTITGDLDGALGMLRSFTRQYHPHLLRSPRAGLSSSSSVTSTSLRTAETQEQSSLPSLPSAMYSTRVALFANRPLVRLTSPVEPTAPALLNSGGDSGSAPDTAPPLLTFSDLELLHHRLVCAGPKRGKDVDFIRWVSSAYAGALKERWESAVGIRGRGRKEPSRRRPMEIRTVH